MCVCVPLHGHVCECDESAAHIRTHIGNCAQCECVCELTQHCANASARALVRTMSRGPFACIYRPAKTAVQSACTCESVGLLDRCVCVCLFGLGIVQIVIIQMVFSVDFP